MNKFAGVFTALITPFTDSGELDEEGLRHLICFQLESKVDGIVVLGTTGEAPTLDEKEKDRVVAIAREEIDSNALLIVGTGSYSTAQTIKSTQKAAEQGADAALIVTPYYNKPTQEGLFLHFKAIASSTALPIIVYNHQGRTGQNLQTDTLLRIASLPTIVGVKEASGNISQISDVIESLKRARPDFTVLSGDDTMTLSLMALGGDGVISVVSNLIPEEIVKLCSAASDGDFARARNLHYKFMPLFKASFIETNPIPIKTAMELCGLPSGKCRLPLCELQSENAAKLETCLKRLNIVETTKINNLTR